MPLPERPASVLLINSREIKEATPLHLIRQESEREGHDHPYDSPRFHRAVGRPDDYARRFVQFLSQPDRESHWLLHCDLSADRRRFPDWCGSGLLHPRYPRFVASHPGRERRAGVSDSEVVHRYLLQYGLRRQYLSRRPPPIRIHAARSILHLAEAAQPHHHESGYASHHRQGRYPERHDPLQAALYGRRDV